MASSCHQLPSSARLNSGRRLQHAAFSNHKVASRLPSSPRPAVRDRQQLQVCAAKGKKGMRQGGQQAQRPQMPPTPPVDPDNVEFVMFVRNPKLPQWYPFSITKGGRPANLLVQSMGSEWGQLLFGKTLVRSLAQPLWQDKKKITQQVRKTLQPLATAQNLEWGFKIRDKTNPKAWLEGTNVTKIPEENELEPALAEKIANWLRNLRK